LVILRIRDDLPSVNEKLRLVLLREIPEDAELRQRWNALVARVDRPQVFYTYEWSLAVQRAYHASLHPLIFLAYDEQEGLWGVASLAASLARTAASFLCANTGDYCDFLSLPGHKFEFVAGVLVELKKQGIENITLTNLPADSNTSAAIRQAAGRSGYHCFTRPAYECAQVSLEEIERRPGGNKPVLPRKKMLRRFLNAMGREAPVRLDHAQSWDAIGPILPAFIEAHVARFLATGRVSNLARPERRVFLEELAKLLSEAGWMRLTRLAAGEKSFAWNYGFQFQDTWFWYQPTFDSDVEKYSPGFCLLAKIIEEAADNPALHTIDLGLGAEEYKERFANRTRETLCVKLSASAAVHLREILRYRLSATVRTWPAAERAVRALSVRYGAFRQRLRAAGVSQTSVWLAKRVRSAVATRDEVFFYELTNPTAGLEEKNGVCLQPIDWKTLAAAAVQNAADEGTLAYLLRCAHRLKEEPGSAGFALTNPEGEFLHFTWAGPFESFHWAELNSRLPSPAPGSVILFDSWTPVSQRGRGYYAPTLAAVVARIRKEGRRAWGFSASTNTSSVRGLEKAGFRRCFSVVRYRFLWWQKIVQRNAGAPDQD